MLVLNTDLNGLDIKRRLMMDDIINLLNNGGYQAKCDETNVSNPPTDAELDAIFGTPAEVGAGWFTFLNDAGGDANVYIVMSTGNNWWQGTLGKCV